MVKRHLLLIGLCLVLVASILLVVEFVNPSAPASLRDDSLTFVKDVVGLNMSEYKVVDSHFTPQWDVATKSRRPLYLMRYDLKSSDDKGWVDVFYTEEDGTYIQEPYFTVFLDKPFSPAYPSDKVLNWIKDFLERYQNFRNNATYLSEIRKIVDSIDHIQPMNVTNGGAKMQLIIKQFNEQEIYTTIRFLPVNSTAHGFDNAVTFEFHNGRMLDFFDWYEVVP